MKQYISTKRYRAVILGAGRMGSGFDSPSSSKILTHAHAYRDNPNVELSGFCDKDFNIAKRAAKKWKTQAYENLYLMLKEVRPDIVSVCTPDVSHYKDLVNISKHKPKIVVCEKPLTLSLSETKKILKIYKTKKIYLTVNFSRRFDIAVQKVRKITMSKKYGKVQASRAVYSKGIKHNGSHVLDMAHYIFGEKTRVEPLFSLFDSGPEDKTVSGFLAFEKCPQFFIAGVADFNYPIFEFDIFFEKARFSYVDFGYKSKLQLVKNDPVFKEFKALSQSSESKTDLIKALPNMVKNIVDFLNKKEHLLCLGEDALRVQKTTSQLLLN